MSGGVFAFCGTVGVFLNVQFFFWINACYVYMKLKYTPAAGSISFKIRGKLYISVTFLILNTYLGAIIWSSVIALKKVEHFKSVLDYLLWKFFSDKFTQKLKQYSISIYLFSGPRLFRIYIILTLIDIQRKKNAFWQTFPDKLFKTNMMKLLKN